MKQKHMYTRATGCINKLLLFVICFTSTISASVHIVAWQFKDPTEYVLTQMVWELDCQRNQFLTKQLLENLSIITVLLQVFDYDPVFLQLTVDPVYQDLDTNHNANKSIVFYVLFSSHFLHCDCSEEM